MDMKRILQAMDSASTKPVEGANDMKKFLSVVSEGKNPKTNRLSTAEQMVVQEYVQPKKTITNPVLNVAKDATPSMIGKYFKKIEEEFAESNVRHKQRAKQLAERVVNKMSESPIAMDPAEPNNPTIHSHEKANPMSLKGRIQQTRNQLKELANMAESDDLIVWEKITQLAKGGMFMGLEQNLEQIRHGISELAAKRKKGGVTSRGIDKNIGEQDVAESKERCMQCGMPNCTCSPGKCKCKPIAGWVPGKGFKKAVDEAASAAQQAAIAIAKKKEQKADESLRTDNPCWKGYKPVGTKKKSGRTVPNCVPK